MAGSRRYLACHSDPERREGEESLPSPRSLANSANGGPYAAWLRQELSARNQSYAAAHGLPARFSLGEPPVVCYGPAEDGRSHGNFYPASYRAIQGNPSWQRRFRKVHTSAASAFISYEGDGLRELDSSNSSDALLMNIFCYPGLRRDARVCGMLGVEAGAKPEFGWRARVPFAGGGADATEVDMRLGDLLVEAKLTEGDFQLTRDPAQVERYRDFAEVFEQRRLPRARRQYLSYQLIRNVLAAHVHGCSFCVLLDQRRPDLREAWFAVLAAVRPLELRLRCKVLTWQELAGAAPARLRTFLEEKYGIAANW